MLEHETKRGYMSSDEREFVAQIGTLRKASKDVLYLLEAGYPVKNVTTFVGNHYLLSERQRLALARSIASRTSIRTRKEKEVPAKDIFDKTVHIDGFNTIISLEIAFSGSTLLKCMDGTIRDLAGLRGTYRIIDKTETAVRSIRNVLLSCGAICAVFYLDAPVSNSGRLKGKIAEIFDGSNIELNFQVIAGVDRALMEQHCVVTSDAIILDKCKSWFNLVELAIHRELGSYPFVRVIEDTSFD